MTWHFAPNLKDPKTGLTPRGLRAPRPQTLPPGNSLRKSLDCAYRRRLMIKDKLLVGTKSPSSRSLKSQILTNNNPKKETGLKRESRPIFKSWCLTTNSIWVSMRALFAAISALLASGALLIGGSLLAGGGHGLTFPFQIAFQPFGFGPIAWTICWACTCSKGRSAFIVGLCVGLIMGALTTTLSVIGVYDILGEIESSIVQSYPFLAWAMIGLAFALPGFPMVMLIVRWRKQGGTGSGRGAMAGCHPGRRENDAEQIR
jgi:hypothetical protein